MPVHLRHVAREDDRAQPFAPVDQRQRAHGDRRGASGDLHPPRRAAHDHDGHGLLDEAVVSDDVRHFLGEHFARHVGTDPQAAQARHGVRGGLLHPPLRVQQQRAVEDAGHAVGGDLRRRVVGVLAACHHLAQRVGGGHGPPLESQGEPGARQVRLARDDRDDRPVVAHGHAGLHHRVRPRPARRLGADDLPGLHRAAQFDLPRGGQVQADDVVDVDGRGGRGTAVRCGDEAPVVRGQPQDQVGRGQIGQHLPIREEQVEPIDVLVGQRR